MTTALRLLPLLSLAIAPLLAGCEGTSKRPSSRLTVGDDITVETLYEFEGRRPPLEQVSLLRVLSPDRSDGVGVVVRVKSLDTGKVFHPELKPRYVLEVLPGRYEIDASFWQGRTRFERAPTGERALVDESLRAAGAVLLELVAEPGKIYCIRPEVRRTADLLPAQQRDYHAVRYLKRTSQVSVAPPDQMEITKDYLWRPRVHELTPEEAREFRGYR